MAGHTEAFDKQLYLRILLRKMGYQLPIGDILHILRQRPRGKSMSQEEVAEKTGIRVLELVHFERNTVVPMETDIKKLAEVYDFPQEILEDYASATEIRLKWLREA